MEKKRVGDSGSSSLGILGNIAMTSGVSPEITITHSSTTVQKSPAIYENKVTSVTISGMPVVSEAA